MYKLWRRQKDNPNEQTQICDDLGFIQLLSIDIVLSITGHFKSWPLQVLQKMVSAYKT